MFECTLEYGTEILQYLVESKVKVPSITTDSCETLCVINTIINLEQRCKIFSDYFIEFIFFPILNNFE